MAYEFKLPDLGEGIHEGEIKKWHVREGDKVKADQTIAELETDKAVVEMPSPKPGTVLKLFGKEGEKIKVGQVLIVIGQEGESYGQAPAQKPVAPVQAAPKPLEALQPVQQAYSTPVHSPTPAAQSTAPVRPPPAIETVVTGVSQHALATPFVRKIARELNVNIEKIKGTGPHGRVTEQDIRNAAQGGGASSHEASRPAPAPSTSNALADIIQAPVTSVSPSAGVSSAMPPQQYAPPVHPRPPIVIEGEVERVPFKGVRRTISQHMVASFQTAVHVTHVDEVDMTSLAAHREKDKPLAQAQGIKLTYMPFIIKALVAALKAFPVFNSSLDEEKQEIVVKKYYNIGIAVDTEEGLMVPVVKNADKKTVLEIAHEIQDLAEKARTRKLAIDQMRGGSCTITNIGSAGGIFATPIINYPEVAILGVYKIQDRVTVVKDEAEIRKIMNVSITFDHRVIDGAQAARFVTYIKKHLEDPGLLLINE